MPKQRIGIVLIALAAIVASLDIVWATVVLALVGVLFVDE